MNKAGIIVRSVSPWVSRIVVMPKKSQPGEPPPRKLCINCRGLNNLLTPVT